MENLKSIICERCGSSATMEMVTHKDDWGLPSRKPKGVMKNGMLHVTITCPECGRREQRVPPPTKFK
jgi:hypothetical protein